MGLEKGIGSLAPTVYECKTLDCRTALELCKLLLGLDPVSDPLAVVLLLDFYALRARQYRWLVDLYTAWDPERNLHQLPNMSYSPALATFHLSIAEEPDLLTTADQML